MNAVVMLAALSAGTQLQPEIHQMGQEKLSGDWRCTSLAGLIREVCAGYR